MVLTIKGICTWMFSLAILFSVSSCKKSTYYQLTEEEMTWLVYKNNEVLKFENQNGELLRYYVTLRVKGYDKDGDTYNESTGASFIQLNDTTALFTEDSQGSHNMRKSADGFLVTLTWPHFPIKAVPLSNRVPSFVTIGGINYDDVFVIDASNFTDIRYYNKTLWVSKSKGVLQIEDTSGNIWVRDFL